jgi:hypothetical protein
VLLLELGPVTEFDVFVSECGAEEETLFEAVALDSTALVPGAPRR